LQDRGEQETAQDLLVGEAALLDPHLGAPFLDDAGDLGVRTWGAVALLVPKPAGLLFRLFYQVEIRRHQIPSSKMPYASQLPTRAMVP
jgi:hypothetical protein